MGSFAVLSSESSFAKSWSSRRAGTAYPDERRSLTAFLRVTMQPFSVILSDLRRSIWHYAKV